VNSADATSNSFTHPAILRVPLWPISKMTDRACCSARIFTVRSVISSFSSTACGFGFKLFGDMSENEKRWSGTDPESLAEHLVRMGDGQSAVEIINLIRKRKADSSRLDAVLEDAAGSKHADSALPGVEEDDADNLARRGYLDEALFLFNRLSSLKRLKRTSRAEVVRRILSLKDSVPGITDVKKAEALLLEGKIASSLLSYRSLARRMPSNWFVLQRANDLKELILDKDVPGTVSCDKGGIEDVLRLCLEGRYADALSILSSTAIGPDAAPWLTRLFEAVDRIRAVASRSTDTGTSMAVTGRMDNMSLVTLHLFMGNVEEASGLLEKLINRGEKDDNAHLLLDDLRVLLSSIRSHGLSAEKGDRKMLSRQIEIEQKDGRAAPVSHGQMGRYSSGRVSRNQTMAYASDHDSSKQEGTDPFQSPEPESSKAGAPVSRKTVPAKPSVISKSRVVNLEPEKPPRPEVISDRSKEIQPHWKETVPVPESPFNIEEQARREQVSFKPEGYSVVNESIPDLDQQDDSQEKVPENPDPDPDPLTGQPIIHISSSRRKK